VAVLHGNTRSRRCARPGHKEWRQSHERSSGRAGWRPYRAADGSAGSGVRAASGSQESSLKKIKIIRKSKSRLACKTASSTQLYYIPAVPLFNLFKGDSYTWGAYFSAFDYEIKQSCARGSC